MYEVTRRKEFYKMVTEDTLICVNPDDRKVVFKTEAYKRGEQTHHWVRIQGRHYLSVQSQKNIFKFFKVSATNGFTEDKALTVTLDEGDDVRYVEFDKNFENMYLVKNEDILEQRTVSGGGGVVMNIKLEEKVDFGNTYKQRMSLSDDGTLCALGAGNDKPFWFLIDIPKRTQFKVTSSVLKNSFAPRFLTDESGRVVIGGVGKMEIWNFATRYSEKVIDFGSDLVKTIFSVGNVLAVGGNERGLRLYDVRNWEMIYSKKYEMQIQSLQLTSDLEHLVVAGTGGEKCIILKITH